MINGLKMKGIVCVIAMSMMLMLAGCGEESTSLQNNSRGNFTAGMDSLSFVNKADIKSDLKALKAITDVYSLGIEQVKGGVKESDKTDTIEGKRILQKAKVLLEEASNKLIALNLKSWEIQNIRIETVKGMQASIEILELGMKERQTLTHEDAQQYVVLKEQVARLEHMVDLQLTELDERYPE